MRARAREVFKCSLARVAASHSQQQHEGARARAPGAAEKRRIRPALVLLKQHVRVSSGRYDSPHSGTTVSSRAIVLLDRCATGRRRPASPVAATCGRWLRAGSSCPRCALAHIAGVGTEFANRLLGNHGCQPDGAKLDSAASLDRGGDAGCGTPCSRAR